MYDIWSAHNYVTLSCIVQLVNYMFQPLYLAFIRLYLAYRGLYYITSVNNGRQDLVYNGHVRELNRMVPIFTIYILHTIFYSVTGIMFIS